MKITLVIALLMNMSLAFALGQNEMPAHILSCGPCQKAWELSHNRNPAAKQELRNATPPKQKRKAPTSTKG